ncbi:hypothetical protein N7454_008456 [Penicillium verhagenii]|nr:hypothetical protein N7454_008456 [Penicillium verhagenii]
MWLPIANLLRKFSSLNDLLYDGLHQFAPCMLQAINEDSSSCRLWMNRFKLHSLGAEQIDPHEVALLSSPRLYSIKFDDFMSHGGNASGDNSIGEENKQDEDILYRTVASLSPFLKEVHSCYRDDQPYYPTDESSELQNRIDGQVTRSSLRYLSISGCENKSINKETMTMWNDFTDFSTLRTLRITNPLRYQALEFLANDCSFETLQSLELSLSLFATRLAWRLGQYDTPEARFLCSLRPLTNLTINDWTNKYPLECFLPHHGGKLTKLAILTGKNTHLLPSDVKQISEYCPNLQELEITLPRTQGNATEVESYRNLGRLPQLQSLTIRLDVTTIKLCNSNCSGRETPTGSKCVFTAPDASFDEFDMRPCKRRAKSASRGPLCRKGDFREMLINHAIDQNLAKAIFENIQSEKEPGTKPLKSLNLLCVGALGLKKDYMGSVWHFPHQEVLSALKRSWRVNRLSTGGLEAEEICTSSPKAETGESGNDPLPYILEGPFRRLWPEQQVGSDWFRDWSSLPLGTI